MAKLRIFLKQLKIRTQLDITYLELNLLFLISVDTSLSGYLSEVSPLKLSKDKKKKVL